MNRKIIILSFFLGFLLYSKNVLAYDINNYRNRSLCGNYEVASFKDNGDIKQVSCHSNYEDAKNSMKNSGGKDLAILTRISNTTKIIDANVALLDLSVNPETLTYFYTNSECKGSAYTYMDTGSLYGGVDGIHLETAYSNYINSWVAKVTIGNFTGWIKQSTYEIVPITWVKSSSSYTVTNSDIRHNYVAKIQNNYYGSAGRTIGPKPDMLSSGTYYSYDGHYFYNNLETLIRDSKKNSHSNSVNKDNPYYNYYMYLSNHTKTAYSSINIDEYIRNNLGYKENVYGNAAKEKTSRLYGSGTFFYYAQEKYGVNAILSLSLSRNETGNGTSNLSINKNNGFGLNAVDSNPTQAANWYPTFSSSILGYASKWITYGYAHPRDWRYFGPQFGDKWIGMNVKYASDTYWSEKMAANYYSFDKAFGMQDYNYYQLGVVNGPTDAYQNPSTSSKKIYTYPEKEDAVVIIDEVEKNNEKWYKVVSDLNIDNNYNEKTSGDYNWNQAVYVKASGITKINKAKNGLVSPLEVFEYKNKNYEYDLYIENAELKPRVAISTKNTPYYYDSSLSSSTGKTLLKDRYVMVYTVAYSNNIPVAYLVTSDYFHDQKEWISADSIQFKDTSYGKVSVTVSGNQYTWVNYNTEDAKYSLISGLYTNSYIPVLEKTKVGNNTWLKVPVSLTDSNNIYGYTLESAPGVKITLSTPIVENTKPIIKAVDKTIYVNEEFNPTKDVEAVDQEDGNLTNKIEIIENNVDNKIPGEYKVTYKVKDSNNQETILSIKVTVKENIAPVINTKDKTITEQDEFDAKKDVTATDEEDGDLTSKIKVNENTVNNKKVGEYKVIYEVTDSKGKTTTKEIKVTVKENKAPVINAKDKTITEQDEFDAKKDVTATDEEDGNLTSKIKVKENTVNIKTPGEYKVIYEVTDSKGKTTTKEIKVTVAKKEEKKEEVKEEKIIDTDDIDIDSLMENLEDGEFYLNNLTWNKTTKKFTISGYCIILNQDNKEDKEYAVVFINKDTEEGYVSLIDSWTKNTPYDLGTDNGKDYSNSWFKGEIDFTDIPNGDYDLYLLAANKDNFTIQGIDNFFNIDIDRRGEDSKHGYNFKTDQKSKSKEITLSVRDELYTTKTSPTTRNMVNGYDEISFKNNKLYIYGYSYDYEGTYNNQSSITRKIILENTKTFKQEIIDVSSTKGPFTIKTQDNKDKTYAWFEKEIDLSKLEKGTYSILVYTKTTDATNYDELQDLFRSVNDKMNTNNKEYILQYNKDRQNRIEIIVK